MVKKLDGGEKNFIRLIARGQEQNGGWAKVSKPLYPLVKNMPAELVEHKPADDDCGWARLTPHGEAILEAMNWL
jgi:hypothetical protein